MSLIDLRKDAERHTITLVAEYEAPPTRIWELWADPRQLERWWGPPSHPSTVTDSDLTPGGLVRYFMTGPEGDRYHGGWRVLGVDEPRRLEFSDFFANEDGSENPDMPASTTVVSIVAVGDGRTRMTAETRYSSAEEMAQVLAMGMEEGIRLAVGQIDALLAERPA